MTVALPPDWQTLSCPKVPEFKVWITMGDKVLTSHKKDTLEPTKVGAEIAGIEGKEFQINIYDGRTKAARPFEHDIYLDGKNVCGYWEVCEERAEQSLDSQKRFVTMKEVSLGKGRSRPFVFGKIATTSEAVNADQSAKALAKVATIKVELRRYKNVRRVRVSKKDEEAQNGSDASESEQDKEDEEDEEWNSNVGAIDEKAKKAQFGLSAGLGAIQRKPRYEQSKRGSAEKSSGWTYVWRGDRADRDAWLTFTFRIRSPIGLQDEILPDEPSPQPVASTSKRRADSIADDDDEAEDEDEEAIDAKLKQLEEKMERLRAKRAKTAKPDTKPKRTPPPPFDWQGRPPIEKETRWYIDYEADEAEKEEERMLEMEQKEREERQKNAVEI